MQIACFLSQCHLFSAVFPDGADLGLKQAASSVSAFDEKFYFFLSL